MTTENISKLMDGDPIIKADKANAINIQIEFMTQNKVILKCKMLISNSTTEDFTVTNNDEKTMTVAWQAISEELSEEQATTEWERNTKTHRKKEINRRTK